MVDYEPEPTPFDDVDDHPLPFREVLLQMLDRILQELRRGAADRSSVKITLQRGTVDITCHAYEGSDIRGAEREAIASYERTIAAMNQQGTRGFEKTLEAIKEARS